MAWIVGGKVGDRMHRVKRWDRGLRKQVGRENRNGEEGR